MEEEKREKVLFKKGQEFLEMYRRVEDFTHELLKENEKLRFKVAQLNEKSKFSGTEDSEEERKLLELKLRKAEIEKQEILNRYQEVESENVDFANRYVEIEEENNNLANLYVASYQLHSTLDFKEVLQIVLEIIINLVGAEQFSVMLLDEKKNMLSAVTSEGIEREKIPGIPLEEGIIGNVVKTGESYYDERMAVSDTINFSEPLVCIPMKIKEHIIGAIVIYKLLQQKESFNTLDYELFNLLGGHAATAIFSAKLYSESERKLATVQGFLDLLTQ